VIVGLCFFPVVFHSSLSSMSLFTVNYFLTSFLWLSTTTNGFTLPYDDQPQQLLIAHPLGNSCVKIPRLTFHLCHQLCCMQRCLGWRQIFLQPAPWLLVLDLWSFFHRAPFVWLAILYLVDFRCLTSYSLFGWLFFVGLFFILLDYFSLSEVEPWWLRNLMHLFSPTLSLPCYELSSWMTITMILRP